MSTVPDDARAAMRATMRAAGGAATAAGWAALWQNKMMTWDLGEPTAVLLAEVEAEMAAGREANGADTVRRDIPLGGVEPDEPERALDVLERPVLK